jgi:rubrerythrin
MQKVELVLKKSIEGELTAIAKYKKYAEIALKAGFKGVARLFRALTFAETFHVKNHQRALGEDYTIDPKPELMDGIENILMDAKKGETWEYKEMYPGFLADIPKKTTEDQVKLAKLSMEWARDVEKTHAEVLEKVIEIIKSGKDIENERIWVCVACGNIAFGELPEKYCPVCKHDLMFFTEITEEILNE